MVDLTIAAIPFFWGSMGAEALYLKRTRDAGAAPSAGDYEWRDTATSLGMGVASLVVPAVTRYATSPDLFARRVSAAVLLLAKGSSLPGRAHLLMPKLIAGGTV